MHLQRHFHRVSGQHVLLIALTLLVAVPAMAQNVSPGPDTAQAVLKTQDIKFYYQSFDTFYSCEGIEDKVKRLLRALGADKDLTVEAKSCSEGRDLVRDLARSPGGNLGSTPQVTVHITSAVEATPEVLAEMAKTRAQRELTARVQGNSSAAALAETQFQSPWTPVSLTRGSLGLEGGDCELVQALRKQVLPKLGVRVVSDKLRCLRQGNRFQPQLEVEALMLPPHPEGGFAVPPSADKPDNVGEGAVPPPADKPQEQQ